MIIKNDILMSATSADVQNGTIIIPKSIKLPNTIQFLDNSAFHDCKNLEELWASDSLDHLYLHSFHGCKKLKKIHWKGKLYTIDDLIAY